MTPRSAQIIDRHFVNENYISGAVKCAKEELLEWVYALRPEPTGGSGSYDQLDAPIERDY